MRLSRFLAVLFVVALSSLAEAQQPKKVPRIGYLSSGTPSSEATKVGVEAWSQGLRELRKHPCEVADLVLIWEGNSHVERSRRVR
jgi:hypothetical protein